uniref:Uncharacterized protein n=1 Tax=Spongospora subterranea TaxID=70186 RepID=A0A0H5QZD5_9EUKA|eukprot:CRZ07076.1 hypothetical protein [Spongospora subterranea]
MFVGPELNDDQATEIICMIFFEVGQDLPKFLRVIAYLLENNVFRLRMSRVIAIDYSRRFNLPMDDSSALIRFRFTIGQLNRLVDALQLHDIVETDQIDRTTAVEALAMLCRRLAQPVRLTTISNEFGRSPPFLSRIINKTINLTPRAVRFIFDSELIVATWLANGAIVAPFLQCVPSTCWDCCLWRSGRLDLRQSKLNLVGTTRLAQISPMSPLESPPPLSRIGSFRTPCRVVQCSMAKSKF